MNTHFNGAQIHKSGFSEGWAEPGSALRWSPNSQVNEGVLA